MKKKIVVKINSRKVVYKVNRMIWFVTIFILFVVGNQLRTSSLLGYMRDYIIALQMSLQADTIDKVGGFYTVGRIFHAINLFEISTLDGWAFLLMIIYFPLLYYYCRDITNIGTMNVIFICGFFTFFVACSCNISKEAIQVMMFLVIDKIAFYEKHEITKIKIVSIFAIFILNGFYLRQYFLITAFVFLALTIVCVLQDKFKLNIKRDIVIFFLVLLVTMEIGRKVAPPLYYEVTNVRSQLLYTYRNANTLIPDMIHINNSVFNWLLNYVISSIRILFPVELIIKGIKYIPFVIVQLYFSIEILKMYEECNQQSNSFKIAYSALLAFMIVELMWEVDLGTMFRHETSAFFLIVSLFMRYRLKDVCVKQSICKRRRQSCVIKKY